MVFNHLEEILKPCPQEEFLNSSWGKTFKHVRGWPGKFSHFLPWDQLNRILQQHRLDFPRLRLTRDGHRLPTDAYLRHTTGVRHKVAIPRLVPSKLTAELRLGATLVLDAVDELSEPVRELAEGLELFFREHVQVNAYAGWRTSKGFDLHWDDHDVFILQVTGRKRWRVYGATRPYPLTRDIEQARKPTADEPLWEETLADGDLLYIPRGFWHVAFPLDEPTLHLTVGLHNRTGLDLLRWLTDELRKVEIFRKDLPRFASASELEAHFENLRAELLAVWDADLLKRYFEAQDAGALARPSLSLPWDATLEILPAAKNVRVRLNAPRPLDLRVENGVVEFSCQQKRWRFAEDALLILRPLAERRVSTVASLCEAAAGRIEAETVRVFLKELIVQGLLTVVLE
ncbi:MAG TPA: cupin domain-containing protein [Pyrinomonadaceae bacterium]